MMDLIRKPAPKWNIYYQDSTGKFHNQLVYSDEERDEVVAQIEEDGGTVLKIYERN
ncbi:hypothetical protein ECBP2_0045 [Escherichia phage ECBP2]|uniref:Uncharacterized protein n=1 Tax=Escherichia phage ECBP2 TaxID=1604355 RepID=J9SV94_9CAUD|nr:hypothetical protein ECBP2_0045 [Escherichia phage ECBP2]AFR52078.1 hypothetical protein ECBP2_0045 [Escherichia phage ECBP2]